ncbi:MAG: ABC transporter substrate-binding protein, partial [Thermomicrobiales bacterium]
QESLSRNGQALSRRRLLQAGAGLALAGGLIGPGAARAAQDAEPKDGGVLRYGLSTDPSNFEPHVSTGAASGTVKMMVYSQLLTYSDEGEFIGNLAEEFDWVDDLTYRVKVYDGVTFHDGSPLTVDDIIFSFDRIKNPDTAASMAGRLADLESVVAGEGENEVLFKLSQPNVVLPYALADHSTAIVSKAWIESGVDPKTTMMGTGPFKFVERQPGIVIKLEKNPDYFMAGLPHLDGIDFQPMPDDNARVTALRSGTVDFIDYVPYTQMDTIDQDANLVFTSDSVLGFGWIGFNLDLAPVSDPKVREAFAYGLDRDRMVKIAFSGHGAPITGGIIPEGWIGYAPDLEGTFMPDPAKSQALLGEAASNPLNIDIVSTSTYTVISRPAEAAQAELMNAGINGNLVMQEWLTFRQSVTDGTYPVHVWGSSLAYNDPDAISDYVASNGVLAKQFRFSDERIDALLVEGRQTSDEAKRNEIYQQVQVLVAEVFPLIFTIRRTQGEAHSTKVKGYNHIAAGGWTQVNLRNVWLDQ